MVDVCLLGSGGMMPLPYRWLTSMLARYNGKSILIDCGEGTQIALKKQGWSPKPIDIICITHYHADHISGLPGMLLTMGNAERKEPLTIIGPKGLTRVVKSLRVIAPELPFEVNCVEIADREQAFQFEGFRIEAFRVNHNVTCYGYSIVVDRGAKFLIEKAEKLPIERKYWGPLQKGETIHVDGVEYTPDMVLGNARKGIKVTYCTDTRPVPMISAHAQNADLFICEGMYGDPEKSIKAVEHKHMTMYEAAGLAKDAGVKSLWLTHYSPSLTKPDEYLFAVREIFSNTEMGKDGKTIELIFGDE